MSEKQVKKSSIPIIVIGIIAVLGIISAAYFYIQYQKSQQLLKNPSLAAKIEIQSLINKVNQIMVLPTGEEPVVETVTDITKLKDPFFAKAKNGDKVLIYTTAKEAILYDPVANKIIQVAPINIGQVTTPNTLKDQSALRITLLNGSSTIGLTNLIEQELKSKLNNVIIVSKDKATKSDYPKTLVVDLTGNKKAQASQLAAILGGELVNLPSDEAKPSNSDILIIAATSSASPK